MAGAIVYDYDLSYLPLNLYTLNGFSSWSPVFLRHGLARTMNCWILPLGVFKQFLAIRFHTRSRCSIRCVLILPRLIVPPRLLRRAGDPIQ